MNLYTMQYVTYTIKTETAYIFVKRKNDYIFLIVG